MDMVITIQLVAKLNIPCSGYKHEICRSRSTKQHGMGNEQAKWRKTLEIAIESVQQRVCAYYVVRLRVVGCVCVCVY